MRCLEPFKSSIKGQTLDFESSFRRVSMHQLVQEATGALQSISRQVIAAEVLYVLFETIVQQLSLACHDDSQSCLSSCRRGL